ncbi:hypothetical protein FEM03_06750 [Phragmitibacter flavus]|uniref:Uncharacterized protein n=1 Tax=Phragmitibacter flavus TaxID=2576071 RepID=A0A5R8KHN2_9BACT|nr:hypothetical protein [Phragmitibacter flavus]TLD71826.1 hypothetical protein FEM03_06750 [Phragmitibacter flavus]
MKSKANRLSILLLFITVGLVSTKTQAQLYSPADKINRVTTPTNPPVVQAIPRPDLFPFAVSAQHVYTGTYFREYDVTSYVANIGNADATGVHGWFGMRVIASTDPDKYPVGKTCYIGYTEFGAVPSYDYAESNFGGFSIPLSVTKCEVVLVIDRPLESFDDTWLNDTGDLYRGSILESDEDNNISAPQLYDFTFKAQKSSKATRVLVK